MVDQLDKKVQNFNNVKVATVKRIEYETNRTTEVDKQTLTILFKYLASSAWVRINWK